MTARIYIPCPSDRDNRMRLDLPYHPANRDIMHAATGLNSTWAVWDGRAWMLPRSYFRPVADALIERFGSVQITKDFTAKGTCRVTCLEAMSSVEMCECACLGEGHGSRVPNRPCVVVGGDIVVYHDRQRRTWVERAELLAVS